MSWERQPPKPIFAGAYLSAEDHTVLIELLNTLIAEKQKHVTLSDVIRIALRDSHSVRVRPAVV
jgi:hypothetical protein